MLYRLFGSCADDLVIGHQQIIAGHSRLARESGGDDDDIRVRGGFVVVRAGDRDVIAFNRSGFQNVETFALRHALDNIDQNDISQFFVGNAHSAIRADISGAYNGNFFSHRWGTQAELYLAHLQGSPSHQHGVRIDEDLHWGLTQIRRERHRLTCGTNPFRCHTFPRQLNLDRDGHREVLTHTGLGDGSL